MADSPRIEELKRRVQSDPASIAFAALAEEYRRAGRFDEAIDTCTAGLVRHPSYLSAHVTLGRALMDVGRLADARRELESVLKIAPENLAAIRGLAEIHDRLREEGHAQAAASEEPEGAGASADAQMVAEIHAASGFIPPHEEEPPHTPEGPSAPAAQGAAAEAPEAPEAIPLGGPAAVAFAPVHPPDPPAWEFVPAEPDPAPLAAFVIQETALEHPALAGLERFLHAIQRARSERAWPR